MVSITLSVPAELKTEMDKHPEMNWSEIARAAIREKILKLRLLDAIASKSRLTEEDALELGKKINKAMHERLRKKYPGAY